MKILFINPAWDAAGCSYRQHAAINKYTVHQSRHYRDVKTFYDTLDIGPENYNIDEFVSIVEESDVLHFCSGDHTYKTDWGFKWDPYLKKKKVIFHDYNSFGGHWRTAQAIDRVKKFGYNATFSSIPQCKYVYSNCVYVPDLVDEQLPEFSYAEGRDFSKVTLCHFPTGGGNNKNTEELNEALKQCPVNTIITTGLPNTEILKLKRKATLAFDCLWRGFHGATTVENLAIGVPTICALDDEFVDIFCKYFDIGILPILEAKNIKEISGWIIAYQNNLEQLEARCRYARDFMERFWSAEIIANNIIKEYEKL
jgi:hypothetical protein